ncbi:MAG: Gfo/Idh/MocA family oxidoreductase [Candidatus Pristimantibacillus lignocellulolyticus]|uniref:Gfo/Idh/MocA family oxidoreductase n=1 Tax=Candidatus Pristimantibacillus lignocellulolyticus TaxID=2994561 RepID=A0A9J6Z927_9BACL|nr:MAG: Gfo/Idh/MocA family oxidoreductase [Candidatus Pristimantibacillus lignocellulolyticus]
MLKVGIIGAGGIYRYAHLNGWKTSQDIQVVAVCDANLELAELAEQDFPGATIYTDYKQLIAREDIDIVSITTPNKFHSIIAIEALANNKHVFCEKPDAINPEEARKMADIASQSGKILMAMRNNRFTAAAQHVKQLYNEGFFGELYAGRCGWIRTRGIPGRGGWFTTKEMSGGGPLIDLGVHMIDLAMWLSGDPVPKTVSGSTYRKFADRPDETGVIPAGTFDVEDMATGFIRFENGASLQVEFSWASNIEEEQRFLEWRGTEAGFSLINNELTLFTEVDGQVVSTKPEFPEEELPQHTVNIHHFIDCVLGKDTPTITPQDGVHMIQILSAIYESAEKQAEVRL